MYRETTINQLSSICWFYVFNTLRKRYKQKTTLWFCIKRIVTSIENNKDLKFTRQEKELVNYKSGQRILCIKILLNMVEIFLQFSSQKIYFQNKIQSSKCFSILFFSLLLLTFYLIRQDYKYDNLSKENHRAINNL